MISSGEVKSTETEQATLYINTENGYIRIQILSNHLLRVTALKVEDSFDSIVSGIKSVFDEKFPEDKKLSEIIDAHFVKNLEPPVVSYNENDETITADTGFIKICVERKSSRISILDSKDVPILSDYEKVFYKDGKALSIVKTMNDKFFYFGLGERFGSLELRGSKTILYNTDTLSDSIKDRSPLSIPFIIGCHYDYQSNEGICFGLYSDNTHKTTADFTKTDRFSLITDGGNIDYYVCVSQTPKEVISTYTNLTGKTKIPPYWSLGHHLFGLDGKDKDEILKLNKDIREKEIPFESFTIDPQSSNDYGITAWNDKDFPDPSGMIKDLKNNGTRLIMRMTPFIKDNSKNHSGLDEKEADVFCKTPSEEEYRGKGKLKSIVYPDYFKNKTREWWAKYVAVFVRQGIAGIYNDMNEPVLKIGDDISVIDKPSMVHEYKNRYVPHSSVRNLYANYMSMASCMGLSSVKTHERGFVITKSGFAGIQKHACVQANNHKLSWDNLKPSLSMILSLGLSGVSFCGYGLEKQGSSQFSLIPGFIGSSKELYIRSFQLACLMPFFKTRYKDYFKNSESDSNEVERICNKYISLRYDLLPYIYNCFYQSYGSGLPVIRPLFLNYPDDSLTYSVEDQFMIGDDILVCPVVEKGSTSRYSYFPPGCWVDYHNGNIISGGKKVLVSAPLDVLPMFVRRGSMIPKFENVIQSTEDRKNSILKMDVYLGDTEIGEFKHTLYEDDGISQNYKNNVFSKTVYSCEMNKKIINFSIARVGDYHPDYNIIKLTFKDMVYKPEKVFVTIDEEGSGITDKEVIKVTNKINYKKSTGFCQFTEDSENFPSSRSDIIIMIPGGKYFNVKIRVMLI